MSEYYAALIRQYIYGRWNPGTTTIPEQKAIEKILLAAPSLRGESPPINSTVFAPTAGGVSAA